MTAPITSFQGDARFLSNFWPCKIHFAGRVFPSVEHAYVACKSEDPKFHLLVCNTTRPGDAKRLGRKVVLRPNWELVKVPFMRGFIWQKFSSLHPNLVERLLATGDALLIEGNTWGDTFWGVCNGVGQNHLGKLLMERRKELAQ